MDDLPVRIVCAYEDGALPGPWFQAVRRARRSISRAGYQVQLDLLPASSLRADADVVIASEAVAAGLPIGAGRCVVTEPSTFGATLDALLAELAGNGRVRRGPESPRAIAVHRGFQAIGERARLED